MFNMTDEELDKYYLGKGCKRSELAQLRQRWDKKMNDTLNLTGGKIPFVGVKPVWGEQVYTVPIPHDHLSIRLWDGGLASHGLFLLDLFDLRTRKAVKLPKDYVIHPLPSVGRALPMYGPLVSWEAAMNIPHAQIKEEEERFSVMEGTVCALKRPEQDDFFFAVPERLLPGQVVVPATPTVWHA